MVEAADRPLTVVVVEDHDVLRGMLREHWAGLGHRVVAAPDAASLDGALAGAHADVYVLDIILPGEDGLSLARRLRAADPQAGIVMLTSRGELADRLAGYEAGADAYLPKPVVLEELDAVVAAVARRARPAEPAAYVLDVERARLRGPRGRVGLTGDQLELLAGLARAPDRELASEQLMRHLGRSPDAYRKAALEVQIARLRERLVAAGAERTAIASVRGRGYRLNLPVTLGPVPDEDGPLGAG